MRRWSGVKFTAMTVALSVIISANSMVRAASSESDFWTYEVHTTVSDISVTGFMTCRVQGGYEFHSSDIGSFEVDVLKITGHFEGNVSVNELNRSVTGVFDGYRHEVRGSDATVRDDLRTLVSLSEGYDALEAVSSITVWEILSYSPPLLHGIDTSELTVGDSWNQTTDVTTSLSIYEGADVSNTQDVSTVSVSYAVVWSGVEGTAAGAFQATEVHQSCGSVTESYWYSDEVGRFIRYERTEVGQEEPAFVAVLMDYRYESGSGLAGLFTPLFGLLVVSLAFLAVVVVLAIWRHRSEKAKKTEIASDEAGIDEPKDEGDDSDKGWGR